MATLSHFLTLNYYKGIVRKISFSDAIKKYKREIQEAAKEKSENEPKEGLFGEE